MSNWIRSHLPGSRESSTYAASCSPLSEALFYAKIKKLKLPPSFFCCAITFPPPTLHKQML